LLGWLKGLFQTDVGIPWITLRGKLIQAIVEDLESKKLVSPFLRSLSPPEKNQGLQGFLEMLSLVSLSTRTIQIAPHKNGLYNSLQASIIVNYRGLLLKKLNLTVGTYR